MIKNRYFEIIIGIALGLMISNQSIRALTYQNFIIIYFAVLVLFFSLYFWGGELYSKLEVSRNEILIYVMYFFVIIYAIFSTFETGFHNIFFVYDLLSIGIIYFIGRTINFNTYKYSVYIIFIIGALHSLTVIFNRSYVYSSGVNYLLMSLMIALFTCFSLLAAFYNKNIILRIFFIILYIIGCSALFSMQSRATFIFVAIASVIIPNLYMNHKQKLIFNMVALLIISFVVSFYISDIIHFYENSIIQQRMNSLIYDFKNEQRFITYGLYFENLDNFFVSGFGVGGTTAGIYSNTVEKYPHNFILEFWSEFGLLGLFFSLHITFISIFNFLKYLGEPRGFWTLSIIFIYLFYMMNFMKSFSIYDSYILFLSFGLLANQGGLKEMAKLHQAKKLAL